MRRKHLSFLALTISSLVLSACNLVPKTLNSRASQSKESQPQQQESSSEKPRSSKHVHTASEDAEWIVNDNYHWKECEAGDGAKVEYSRHIFERSNETPAAVDSAGSYHEECQVCGYQRDVTIPKIIPSSTIIVDFVEIDKNEQDQVILTIDAHATNIVGPFDYIKVAFGLASFSISGSSNNITSITNSSFVVGSMSPSETDYQKIDNITNISSDNTLCDFTYSYNITQLGLNNGFYAVFFGNQNSYGKIGSDGNGGLIDAVRESDNNHRYNFRDDSGGTNAYVALVVEDKPPFAFEEVSVYRDEYNQVWTKIGGEMKDGVTLETLEASNPYIRFQYMRNWNYIDINADSSGYEYANNPYGPSWRFQVVGNKAYLHIFIDFMYAGETYNTHINLKEFSAQDCVLDVEGSFEQSYVFDGDSRMFTAYYHPEGAHTPDNIYGNFGFKVTER